MKIITTCTALLLAATAQAGEPAPTEAVTVQPASEPTATTVAPAPVVTPAEPPRPASAPADALSTAATMEPCGPEPYTGWGRGQRAPMYVNLMLSVGGYGEDRDNRLTTRDSKLLEGFGGLFRIGAVLGPHHRLGGRLQSFIRPTKKIALEAGATAAPTNEWGAVTFGFAGPEYIYDTGFGLYGGASAGVGFAASHRNLEDADDRHDHDTEKASAGLAGMLSLGYEWRASKWFAMNVEVYGGLYHGLDDNEASMNGGLFGLGMGVGF
jgi:hypothetical protein